LPDGDGFLFLNSRALTDADLQIVWLDGWFEEFESRMEN